MSFYAERVLPRLIEHAMGARRFAALRERVVGAAAGRVLEIGIGAGHNLPYYRRDLDWVVGVEPSARLLARARRSAAWVHFPVRLHQGVAEALPLEDGTVDTVVTTWTLCSVADPARALAEIRRVLRPQGTLVFVEHGQAPEVRVRHWQRRLEPLWSRLAGGCRLSRPVDQLLAGAGLAPIELETGYLVRGPRPFTFHYCGRAQP